MLPLLPALILLLLQGPANIERMAGSGQLPAALHVLTRHIASSSDRSSAADEVVLASLLAAGQDQQVSKALLHLLTLVEASEPERPRVRVLSDTDQPRIPIPPSLGRLCSGFIHSQRSRDGPLWIA